MCCGGGGGVEVKQFSEDWKTCTAIIAIFSVFVLALTFLDSRFIDIHVSSN